MKETNIALIDADSLCFMSSRDTIEESIENINHRIDEILDETKCNQFILCLTGSRNFRYELYPEYKANRKKKYGTPLKYLKTLKAYLIEEYKAVLIQSLEADDIVAYYRDILNATICSPDKDVVKGLKGKHWNYQYKVIDKGLATEHLENGRWLDTSQADADRFFAQQLLEGDVGDNIPGLTTRTQYMKDRFGLDNRQGVGEKTALKILDIIDEKYSGNYASEIAKCYDSKYKGEECKGDEGFNDYHMNRHLLQLNTGIGKYNRILEHYDIQQHVNTIDVVINEIEEF